MAINSISSQRVQNGELNNIPKEAVKERLNALNKETPALYTTSFIKEPQEISLRTVARNNIMLEQVLQNQAKILENQEKILGSKLDKNA